MSPPATSHPLPATSTQSSDDVLVRVEGVSKKFCRSLKKSLWYGVCDIAAELNPFGRARPETGNLKPEKGNDSPPQASSLSFQVSNAASNEDLRAGEFYAVRDVSFELRRGECLGLIGHNGAGKTTLLKMLNGLIKPDSGRIEMRGRIGALIALGAGFNPILTGRENIYVNASVLGLTKKEIDGKMQDIIDFAEIGEFIDSPVQSYSSGMAVRLGFAVAAVLIEPDVLFLDEVLAVGDIGFVIKCLNAVRRLTAKSAVVFVSHNMQFISSFCTRVMVMDHGGCILDASNPADAIDRYFEMIKLESSQSGTGGASIRSIRMKCGDALLEKDEPRIQQGSSACLILDLDIEASSHGAQLHAYVMDESMSPIICIPVLGSDGKLHTIPSGASTISIPLGPLELCAGKYNITVAIMDLERGTTLNRSQGLHPFRIFASETNWGHIVRPAIVSA